MSFGMAEVMTYPQGIPGGVGKEGANPSTHPFGMVPNHLLPCRHRLAPTDRQESQLPARGRGAVGSEQQSSSTQILVLHPRGFRVLSDLLNLSFPTRNPEEWRSQW